VVAKALKKKETAVAVRQECSKLIRYFGSEFSVYESSDEKIRLATSPEIALAISKVKSGAVSWRPGYDGEFGELFLDKGASDRIVDKKQSSLSDF